MNTPLHQRVLSRLIIDPATGCLLWSGALTPDGYGKVSAGGRLVLVHRLMYEWFVGPIPDGLQLDHLCRIRRCGSPAHLEAVTSWVNTMRGESFAAVNAAKQKCDKGHEFDLFNTYIYKGGRTCRACNLEAVRRYQAGRAS